MEILNETYVIVAAIILGWWLYSYTYNHKNPK